MFENVLGYIFKYISYAAAQKNIIKKSHSEAKHSINGLNKQIFTEAKKCLAYCKSHLSSNNALKVNSGMEMINANVAWLFVI